MWGHKVTIMPPPQSRLPTSPGELVMEVQGQILALPLGNSVSWEHWVLSEPQFPHPCSGTITPTSLGSWQ